MTTAAEFSESRSKRRPMSERTCGLCGHVDADGGPCGLAPVGGLDGMTYLCHADDHSCYIDWTVYGVRP